MSDYCIGVRILDAPYQIDREYTYICDIPDVKRGDFVLVPFGRANRLRVALVTGTKTDPGDKTLKTVSSRISEELSLNDRFMGLMDFMCDMNLCSAGDAVRRFIPSDAFDIANETVELTDRTTGELSEKQLDILALLKKGPAKTENLSKKYGDDLRKELKLLETEGYIKRSFEVKKSKGATSEIAFVCEDGDVSVLEKPRTPMAVKEIYEIISENDGYPVRELVESGYSRAHIKSLEAKGLIKLAEREVIRNHYDSFEGGASLPVLNDEQTAAFKELKSYTESGKPEASLLYGITGSGKTSVILSLCKSVIDSGRTVIVLVPEIGLTWQAVSLFASVFGKKLAIIHSGLSDGERFDSYKRIKRGECSIVLGTRSAVFAPLENLGLIVIDEEQEHTYKSDRAPRYHALDIARYRAAEDNSLLILASATPSVETYYKAKTGRYHLVTLTKRFGNAVLPDVIISDMREEKNPAEQGYLGSVLEEELIKNQKEGYQSILLLNRRGYNAYVICRMCGESVLCPNCSVALTYHRTKSGGTLICHYCGYRMKPPKICPSCSSVHLSYGGYGTQLIEDEISQKIPDARVIRMDADSTKGRFSQDDIVESFANKEGDILVGTQMIAKGHNFPKVTLVGVVNADANLYSDDFRAGERTFSLITQVVGRAGRGDDKGRAVIQTHSPYNQTVRLASKQDYEGFYEHEILMRKTLVFPPFCDITTVTFSSEDENSLSKAADLFFNKLKSQTKNEFNDVKTVIYGPFDTPVYKIRGNYRKKIVIKHKNNRRYRQMMSEAIHFFYDSVKDGVSLSVDINPTTI